MMNYEDTNFQTKVKPVTAENLSQVLTAEEQRFEMFFWLAFFTPSTGEIVSLSDEDLHGFFSPVVTQWSWDTGNAGLVIQDEDLDTGPCSDEERKPFLGHYYEGGLITDELVEDNIFRCIRRRDKVKFQGYHNSLQKMFPSIWIKKCEGFDHCKTQEEIDAFASTVAINIIVKGSVYEPDQYAGEFIKTKLTHYFFKVNLGLKDRTFQHVSISEESIESDHKFFSFGFL